MRLFSVFLLFALCAATLPASAFDFSDARRIVSQSDPQISPDAREVVYVRGVQDFGHDRIDRQLVLVDVPSGKSRQLTWDRKGVSGPVWSNDGDAIAFAALDDQKDPKEQIFLLPMDGGDARQITHAKNGVTSWAWSPNNARFAYTMQESDPNEAAEKKHLDAFRVHDNDYLHRGPTPPVHLWVVNSDGSHARKLSSGSWSVALVNPDGGGDLSWSPDSRTVAFNHFDTPFVGDSLDEYTDLADVRTGGVRRMTPGEALQSNPKFAPHGAAIAYERNTNGDYTQGVDEYVATPGGKRIADLRKQLDRNVDQCIWNAQGNALWVGGPDGTTEGLWYWPLHGTIRRVATGAVLAGRLGNVARNGTLVFTGVTSTAPSEIYVLGGPSAKPVAITHENRWVAARGIAPSTGVTWHATKGAYLEDGVLTFPLGYEHLRKVNPARRFPLVLLIHGGPQSASIDAWSAQRQEMASRGYFVFSPNYRGSTNLGDRYQHAITNDAGDGPGKDAMAGLAAVERAYPIDGSRIGVSGWSYGGYMTSWLIGHYHVWKVAVSGASLDDWLDDYDIAFYYDTDVPFFRGKPWNPKNTAEWRAQSPIADAVHATAPTLIMGDIGDNNVTITNSFKLYHALKDNGVTVKFVAYPVHGHFPSDPVRSEDVQKRWLAWLEQYLK